MTAGFPIERFPNSAKSVSPIENIQQNAAHAFGFVIVNRNESMRGDATSLRIAGFNEFSCAAKAAIG